MFAEYTVPSNSGRPSDLSVNIALPRPQQAPRSSPYERHSERPSHSVQLQIREPSDHSRSNTLPGSHHPYPSFSRSLENPPIAEQPRLSANRSIPGGHDGASAAQYSFDVLRPHPFTSDLEHIASTSDVSSLSRGHQPYPAAYPARTALHSIPASNATFRVHIPSSARTQALQRGSPREGHRAENSPQEMNHNTYHSNPHGLVMSLPSEPSDEKKHCCPQCHKRFNRPSSLRIHVNTHTGVRPFECAFPGCSRRFNVNSNMRRHYRNHFAGRRKVSFTPIQSVHGSTLSPPLTRFTSASPVLSSPSPEPSDSERECSRSPSPELEWSDEEYGHDGDAQVHYHGPEDRYL